jgi:hypothetical protein
MPALCACFGVARKLQTATAMNVLGSSFLCVSFVVLPLVLLAAWVWVLGSSHGQAVARTRSRFRWGAVAAAWLVTWWGVGASGVLDVWDGFPPRAAVLLVLAVAITLVLACSRPGTRAAEWLSTRALIGLQAFRFPLELLMYRAMLEGLMPEQMSFSGYNFDILTGILAGLLWGVGAVRPIPTALVWAFNALGLALLVTIVSVAVASLPTFSAFGPHRTNTWVMHFPYIALPTVMVQIALFWHVVSVRKLLALRRQPTHLIIGSSPC